MGVMMYVDYRERGLLEKLNGMGEKNDLVIQNLDLGDVQFVEGESVHMILERKSIRDLAASIKDGRYMEQKQRLLGYRERHPRTKIGYILEGYYTFSPSFSASNMSNKVLSGAIINSMVRDGFQVWSTRDEMDTAYLLDNMHQRFNKEPRKYFKESPRPMPVTTQNAVAKQNPKSQSETIFLIDEDDEEEKEKAEKEIPDIEMEDVQKPNEKDDEKTISRDAYVDAAVSGFHGSSSTLTKKRENMDAYLCLIIQLTCIPGLSSKKARELVQKLAIKSIYGLGELLKEEDRFNASVTHKKERRDCLKSVPGIGPKLAETIRNFLLVD